MAYTLTLTQDERKAFDFVGTRYHTGDDVYQQLSNVECEWSNSNPWGEDGEWGGPGDLTIVVPEHVAWEIARLSECEDHMWPLFATALRNKMQSFVDAIV